MRMNDRMMNSPNFGESDPIGYLRETEDGGQVWYKIIEINYNSIISS